MCKPMVKILVCLLILVPGWALAATRTVCFELGFKDDREDCALTSDAGARRPCNPGGLSWAVGHNYQLWDADSDGNDDLIGTWTVGGPGERCATFEWENASYSKGEADPDVYLNYMFESRCIGKVEAGDSDCNNHRTAVAYRATTKTDSVKMGPATTRWGALQNCRRGVTCRLLPGKIIVPSLNSESDAAQAAMGLDSIQHTLQVYGDVMNTDVRFNLVPFEKIFKICPTGACTNGKTDLWVADGASSMTMAHEIGHIVHHQQHTGPWGSACNAGGKVGHAANESCALTERWANYVAVVSWWDPDNKDSQPIYRSKSVDVEFPRPYIYTSDSLLGPINDCKNDKACLCRLNKNSEWAVAKTLWDLDDRSNESVGIFPAETNHWDRTSYRTRWMARVFRNFPDHDGPGGANEAGVNSPNIWDFVSNGGIFTGNVRGTLLHNCVADSELPPLY